MLARRARRGRGVANLFTDDGVLDVSDSDFKAVRGREALLKFYRASVREPEVALTPHPTTVRIHRWQIRFAV